MRGDADRVKQCVPKLWWKFWNVQKFISKVSRLITTKLCVMHFVNSSKLMRDRWHDMVQTMRHLAVLTDFVPLNGTTWHAIWRNIAGTKFVPLWGLVYKESYRVTDYWEEYEAGFHEVSSRRAKVVARCCEFAEVGAIPGRAVELASHRMSQQQPHLPLPPLSATSEMWCWSGGRGILKKNCLCVTVVSIGLLL